MKTLSLLALTFSLAAFADETKPAITDFDGCYQMYLPSVMYPAFCLDGTNEEGINGAGARLVVFGTNTDTVIACAKSSALGGDAGTFEFQLNGKAELILTGLKLTESGRPEGDVTLGKTKLKFLKVLAPESDRLLKKFYADKRCENLNVGELRNLKTR